ncbi:MAG: hypothetical protein ACI8ZB_000285 [Desulforhopalus sp.]
MQQGALEATTQSDVYRGVFSDFGGSVIVGVVTHLLWPIKTDFSITDWIISHQKEKGYTILGFI